MTATPSTAHAAPIAALPAGPAIVTWTVLSGHWHDLLFGTGDLPAADAGAFHDTMPAVCWAVPGAYATTVEG